MFLRLVCFTLLVCAISQIDCADDSDKVETGELLDFLRKKLFENSTTSESPPSSDKTTTESSGSTTTKKGLGNFGSGIVNNTKHLVHSSSNAILGGVKNVGQVIKGGWNFADNVVDGGLDFAKKIGSFGFKVVTVVPKGLNDVLLDIVEKGQKRLEDKLKKEGNKDKKDKDKKDKDKEDKESSTKKPETGEKEIQMYLILKDDRFPVTWDEIHEFFKMIQRHNKNSDKHYSLLFDDDEIFLFNIDDLIFLGEAAAYEKERLMTTTTNKPSI